jgi:hypothetical protein
MRTTEPNQAIRRSIGLSTAIISLSLVQLIIIGVGVTGPA